MASIVNKLTTPQQRRTWWLRAAWVVGTLTTYLAAWMLLSETPVAPAAVSIPTLIAGLVAARKIAKPRDGAVFANAKQVRQAEAAYATSALFALLTLRTGATAQHLVSGAALATGVFAGIAWLGAFLRVQEDLEASWFGRILTSWQRMPGGTPAAVGALFGISVLAGFAYINPLLFGPLTAAAFVVLGVVIARSEWAEVKAATQSRAALERSLVGVNRGDEYDTYAPHQRIPILDLELDESAKPERLVIPIPSAMTKEQQTQKDREIGARLAGWGDYSVQWYNGGPDGQRRAVIQWQPPLPTLVKFDNRPGVERKVWLGVGKVNRRMQEVNPNAVVGSLVPVVLDFAVTPHALIVGTTGGGKSVAANTIILQWLKAGNRVIILDPKRVGFTKFKGKRGVIVVATSMEEIAEVIDALRNEMDARYAMMEASGYENITEMPNAPVPVMVVIDEATEAMTTEAVDKDDEEGQARNKAAMQIRAALSAIARLGRAAGVHAVVLTQRPDAADGLSGQTKSNLSARVMLGQADSTARGMAGFGDYPDVSATPGVRGRGIYGIVNTAPMEVQFAYAPNDEMDRYLAELDVAPEVPSGASLVQCYDAAEGEGARYEMLRRAYEEGSLTEADAVAVGHGSVAAVVEYLNQVASGSRFDEAFTEHVEAELAGPDSNAALTGSEPSQRPNTPGVNTPAPVGDTENGAPTGAPESGAQTPDLPRHTGKRVEPLPEGQAKPEIEAMIGLGATKRKIKNYEASILVSGLRHAHGVGTGVFKIEHLVFTGPPGTGKTTVARYIGSLLRDIGALPSGHVIEVTPKDLIGGYVGHTGPKADSACDDAMGGVLFIDEAYGLKDGEFAKQALEQIMVRAENDRGKFVVILAGYPDEIDSLLDTNPGMRSRFETRVPFPAYTHSELLQIAQSMVASAGFALSEDAHGALADLVNEQDLSSPDWGNARSVRNLVRAVEVEVDLRLATAIGEGATPTKEDLVTFTTADILAAGQGGALDAQPEEETKPQPVVEGPVEEVTDDTDDTGDTAGVASLDEWLAGVDGDSPEA